jgi:hypothetical protein
MWLASDALVAAACLAAPPCRRLLEPPALLRAGYLLPSGAAAAGIMALNEAIFLDKLDKLNSTQQSIEQTSAWCLFHRGDARKLADVWETFFSKADQPKRLAMVYLANDIVQNGCA